MFRFKLPKINFEVERWKWNKEFRLYVSNMGNILDEYKRPLPVYINKAGYACIRIENFYFKCVHRLVMLTWKPIPNAEDLTIDHLDSNKRNNELVNLEWVTANENQKRANKKKTNEPKNIKIKCDLMTFKNIDTASNYIKNKFFIKDKKVSTGIIKSKIEQAIVSKNTFCNLNWKIV